MAILLTPFINLYYTTLYNNRILLSFSFFLYVHVHLSLYPILLIIVYINLYCSVFYIMSRPHYKALWSTSAVFNEFNKQIWLCIPLGNSSCWYGSSAGADGFRERVSELYEEADTQVGCAVGCSCSQAGRTSAQPTEATEEGEITCSHTVLCQEHSNFSHDTMGH